MHAFIALFAMKASCFGLSPAPRPHTHSIKSENGLFYAKVNARSETTTIKQVRRWGLDKKLWSMKRYIERAALANDGSYLFISGHLISRPFSKNKEVLWIFLADGTTRTFTLGQFVKDTSTLYPAMGAGSWGGPNVIPRGDWIELETCEGRTLFVNAKTGRISNSMIED